MLKGCEFICHEVLQAGGVPRLLEEKKNLLLSLKHVQEIWKKMIVHAK